MAASMRCLFTSGSLFKYPFSTALLPQLPVCGIHTSATLDRYANWKMLKEVRYRRVVKEFAFERLNVNALRKAKKVIPLEIKEIADQEIQALPRNSSISMLHKRCAVTSRPRGLVKRWRLSRMVWRHEADYNKLSGVQRAMW